MNGYNFTENVRRSLTAAREVSAGFGNEYVDPTHVLLGLLRTPKTIAADVLKALSVDARQLAAALASAHERGRSSGGSVDLPYTSRAKKVLELAMVAARERNDTYVGTEHLLLGIIREERGAAAQALVAFGVTLEAVDRVLPGILGSGRARTSQLAEREAAGVDSIEEQAEAYSSKTVRTPQEEVLEKFRAMNGRHGGPCVYSPSTLSDSVLWMLLAFGIAALVVSRVGAYDPHTWLLEVLPIFLAVPLLIFTRRRFPFTPLVYLLILAHALILVVGGHYTYARVPLGFWMRDAFHLSRNHYDRIGHLAQGFVPAIIAREILLRRTALRPGKWLFFLVTCICLSVSVCYEFAEWLAAVLGGSSADAFLGTQGDVWDTQWDMFMALIGALAAQVLLSRLHDRQLDPTRSLRPLRS